MSRSLGNALDDALLDRLSGRLLARRHGEAVHLATLDAARRPHPALLSYAEVVARGPRRMRVAVAAASRTARNLAERHALTLSLVDGPRVVYVKARAGAPGFPIPGFPALAGFDVEVEDVLVDEPRDEERVTRVAGFTYESAAAATAERLRDGARLASVLRE